MKIIDNRSEKIRFEELEVGGVFSPVESIWEDSVYMKTGDYDKDNAYNFTKRGQATFGKGSLVRQFNNAKLIIKDPEFKHEEGEINENNR